MSSRELTDWLTGYLEYTKNSEPPVAYHTWVGISVIASVLQRRCYLKWGHETIYPNMYIVLVGPSGKCRKGTAMGFGQGLISSLNGLSLTSESTTREALIRAMTDASDQYKDASTGEVKFHCSLTCMSGELSVFLGQNDLRFLADLTDWYDSKDVWTYKTKNSGTDKIRGLCFNLLGATAPDWLQSILPEEAIGGGFTSRIIFVVEENKGKTVSLHTITQDEISLREKLKRDLERILLLSGHFRFSEEAESLYKAWYEQEEKHTMDGEPAIEDPRFAGYCDRRATHIRKLCMILSASRGDSMIIDSEDFERARKILVAAETKMPRVFGGLGKSPYSAVTEKVLNYIAMRKVVKRSILMQRFYRDMDGNILRTIEEILEYMKVVKIKRDPASGETVYEYVGPGKKPTNRS